MIEQWVPSGPWAYRRRRPGLRDIRYDPPECGPVNVTVNIGSLPFMERNPEYTP